VLDFGFSDALGTGCDNSQDYSAWRRSASLSFELP
jgi:hypothetical protein